MSLYNLTVELVTVLHHPHPAIGIGEPTPFVIGGGQTVTAVVLGIHHDAQAVEVAGEAVIPFAMLGHAMVDVDDGMVVLVLRGPTTVDEDFPVTAREAFGFCHDSASDVNMSAAMIVKHPAGRGQGKRWKALGSSDGGNYDGRMDKVALFSDIHGDCGMLNLVLARAHNEAVDAVLFLGDFGQHDLMEMYTVIRSSGIPLLGVRGNCDSPWMFSDMQVPVPPLYRSIPLGTRTLFFTHGHAVRSWMEAPVALHPDDIFAYGHSHIPELSRTESGPWVVNPGSASRPRSHTDASMALIDHERIRIVSVVDGRPLKGMTQPI